MELKRKIAKIIDTNVKELDDTELQKITATSLYRFAERTYANAIIMLGVPASSIILVFGYLKSGATLQTTIARYRTKPLPGMTEARQVPTIAQPTGKYDKLYRQEVEKALDVIIKAEPMYDDHISLRNIAEMTVRYNRTIANIEELIARGVNLVQSSRHANCSKRCEKWQGGYYTLDNTYQTVDGIQFQPLSNATDQFYTTKKGKVYKNGHITGYNCRHYLIAYKKGYEMPEVSAETVAKEREIDAKMRYMERQIRLWKDTAIMYKGEDEEKYARAWAKAKFYNSRYIEFAKANKRAFYPSRTDIF